MQEIIKRAKKGDKSAKEEILNRYMPLIYKASSKVFIIGYGDEDLRQTGVKSVLEAIEKYNPERNTNFSAYVKTAVVNNFRYLIRGKCRENYVKSLNEVQEDGFELEAHISMDFNLEEYVIEKDLKLKLRKALEKLTEEEKELLYYAFGKKHGGLTEYAEKKDISYRKVYNFKNSLINKIRKYIV
ncbi:sigma-70 family RNA polymerase sigma factor [Clostridium polynesiense]|uniref:sigma-70 family RNA polymerase sigma factor n=1 Tax=Clostridium polynesiense TaxID=1325933 RepID=UPI00058FCD05|nr:sigma-70 family RNA polymerase sigma factor [Clostridium polynesiense]